MSLGNATNVSQSSPVEEQPPIQLPQPHFQSIQQQNVPGPITPQLQQMFVQQPTGQQQQLQAPQQSFYPRGSTTIAPSSFMNLANVPISNDQSSRFYGFNNNSGFFEGPQPSMVFTNNQQGFSYKY